MQSNSFSSDKKVQVLLKDSSIIQAISLIFDQIGEASFFIKDKKCRFIHANNYLLELLELENLDDLLGIDDFLLFPKHIAEAYRADDLEVMREDKPKLNITELIPNSNGYLDWYVTHKFPVTSKTGQASGICGVCIKLQSANLTSIYTPALSKVLDFVAKNFSERINIAELSDIANMSQRSMERHFKKTFGKTASRYIKDVRLNAASYYLQKGSKTIAEIALDCGFCDQSYMTKAFKEAFGVTPKSYFKSLH